MKHASVTEGEAVTTTAHKVRLVDWVCPVCGERILATDKTQPLCGRQDGTLHLPGWHRAARMVKA